MNAQDVLALYDLLRHEGIKCWIVGGWGIDALLGRESRPHKDLDILVLVEDLDSFFVLLEGHGYSLKLLWPGENLWLTAERTGASVDRPTAFVLADSGGHEVDVHVMEFDAAGGPIPLWQTDRVFTADALTGEGYINGRAVSCMSVAMQLAAHTGYDLPVSHRQDVQALHQLAKPSVTE